MQNYEDNTEKEIENEQSMSNNEMVSMPMLVVIGQRMGTHVNNCAFPGHVIHVAAKAEIKQTPLDIVLKSNLMNSKKIYQNFFTKDIYLIYLINLVENTE